MFGLGGEPSDFYQYTIGNIRWCLFMSICTWYVIKQEQEDGEWYEIWTKQCDSSRQEAERYAKKDMVNHAYNLTASLLNQPPTINQNQ